MDGATNVRLDSATLISLIDNIGVIKGTLQSHSDKLEDIYTAVHGNGRKGLIERVAAVESITSELSNSLERRKHVSIINPLHERRKHSIKIALLSGGSTSGLILIIKLVTWAVSGHWPSIP